MDSYADLLQKETMPRTLTDKIRSSVKGVVSRYRVYFENHGWAYMVVDEELGSLYIQSDWGNYAYTWGGGPKNWGNPSFVNFLLTCSPDYLAEKLTYTMDREEVDIEGTRKNLLEHAEGTIKNTRKDCVIADINTFCDCMENGEPPELAMKDESLEQIFLEFDCLHEWILMKPKGWYQILRAELIPALGEVLIKHN
jgi:hypothetical protein